MKITRYMRAAAKAGVVLAAYLVSTEEERATIRSAFMGRGKDEYVEEYEDDEQPSMEEERAAAYLTTGLLTSRGSTVAPTTRRSTASSPIRWRRLTPRCAWSSTSSKSPPHG
jgi:hypothetical protein